jgi:hypothetical protein
VRKSVAAFLLVFLPLQWGWALAAAYCKHEPVVAEVHFGHHQHQHEHGTAPVAFSNASASPDATGSPGEGENHPLPHGSGDLGLDADCGVCHLGAAHAAAPTASAVPSCDAASAVTSYAASWPASPAEKLFRPPWRTSL